MRKITTSFIIVLLGFIFTYPAFSQANNLTDIEFAKQYSRNIKKEYIDNIYIPKDIVEACEELQRLSPKESIQKFRLADEDHVVKRLHFGLGRWIMINWNFEKGSRYSHLLRSKGVTHPDDMIEFTIRTFHRHLNGKELDIDKRTKEIQDQRKQAFQDKLDKNLIKKETRTVKKDK